MKSYTTSQFGTINYEQKAFALSCLVSYHSSFSKASMHP